MLLKMKDSLFCHQGLIFCDLCLCGCFDLVDPDENAYCCAVLCEQFHATAVAE